MERLIITNGKLILPTGIEMGQTLICENGKIEQIIPNESYQPLVGDKVIDARQNYVSPGFIDMHIHGGGWYCRGFSRSGRNTCQVWYYRNGSHHTYQH